MKKKDGKSRGAIKIEILKAARELVLKFGYKDVSIRAIAGRSGYSIGAVYLHFNTKRDILATLREEGLMKLSERLAGLPPVTDPFLGLRHLCIAFIDFAWQNQDLYQLICAFGIDEPSSIIRDLLPSIETFLRQVSFSPQDRKDATIALAGLLFGLTNLYVNQKLMKIAPELVVNDLYRILDIFLEAGCKQILP
jgi:AcrR family transcriptional regulator